MKRTDPYKTIRIYVDSHRKLVEMATREQRTVLVVLERAVNREYERQAALESEQRQPQEQQP